MKFIQHIKLIVVCFCILLAPSIYAKGKNKNNTMTDVFSKVKDKLVIVTGDSAVGSGFVLEMGEGKKFFVTNEHVVHGQKNITVKFLNGKCLKLGEFEVAEDRDLVRFSLTDDVPSLTMRQGEPNIGDVVYVFGNSDGKGVATGLDGKVLGVGPENIEVSAKFVHGNSGSAILDKKGRAIGVATFATYDNNPKDWTKKDSRFGKVRRFAVRLSEVKWRSMNFSSYHTVCAEKDKKKIEKGVPISQVSARFLSPKMYSMLVPKNCLYSFGCFWIKSDIQVSLSGKATNTIKKPVVRVCVVVKGTDGLHFRDCVLTTPNSMSASSCPPVYSYGNSANNKYHTSTDVGVYFIEGQSYWNGILGDSSKNIKFFDRSKDINNGLFTIHKGLTGGKPPKIVCFRLECWQNGALAGVYDSCGEATLKSKGIPSDWYIKGKYSEIFDYRNINFISGSSASWL